MNIISNVGAPSRAILYIFRKKNAPHKMYIGMKDYNKGKDPASYITSAQSDEFWEDYAAGKLEKVTLFQDTSEYISALEWFGIDYLVNSHSELSYHLSSNGHRGNVKLKPADMQRLIGIVEGTIVPKPDKKLNRVELIDQLVSDVQNGIYPSVMVDIAEAKNFTENQVKGVSLDQHQVDEIVRRMTEHPERARQEIKPLVATRLADGSIRLLNGHHTREAVSRARGWKQVPVIYLPVDAFGGEEERDSNFNLFGLKMNPQGFVLSKSTTKEDCVRDLEKEVDRIGLDLSHYQDRERTKDIAIQTYGGADLLGSTAAAIGVWKTVVNNYEKNRAATRVGQISTYSDRELIVVKRQKESSGYSVVTATFKQAEHAKALGYILRHMKNEGMDKGAIIFHCRTPEEYAHEQKEQWIKDTSDTIKHLNLNVEIDVLPCIKGEKDTVYKMHCAA